RAILEDAPGGEDAQVERMRPAQDQLGAIAPNRVALLETVPREAVRQVETWQLGPFSHDGVAVEGIDLVQAGPAASDLQPVEAGHHLANLRPDQPLDPPPLPAQVL